MRLVSSIFLGWLLTAAGFGLVWSSQMAYAHHSLACINGANNGTNSFWGSNGSSYQSNSLRMGTSLDSSDFLQNSSPEIKNAPPPVSQNFPGKKKSSASAPPPLPPPPSKPSPPISKVPAPVPRKLPEPPKAPQLPEREGKDGELLEKLL